MSICCCSTRICTYNSVLKLIWSLANTCTDWHLIQRIIWGSIKEHHRLWRGSLWIVNDFICECVSCFGIWIMLFLGHDHTYVIFCVIWAFCLSLKGHLIFSQTNEFCILFTFGWVSLKGHCYTSWFGYLRMPSTHTMHAIFTWTRKQILCRQKVTKKHQVQTQNLLCCEFNQLFFFLTTI